MNQVSPRNKLLLLLIGILLMGWLSYQLRIQKTFQQYSQYKENTQLLRQIDAAPNQIKDYQKELLSFKEQVSQTKYKRETLFEEVNTFCRENDLRLVNFTPQPSQFEKDYEIATNTVKVEGKYRDMVRLVYYLEHTRRITHFSSGHFQLIQDRRSKRTYLTGTFFLQNIVSQSNNL